MAKAQTEKKSTRAAKSDAGKRSAGFTAEERAAMRERAKEAKGQAGESDALAKIAEMQKTDRVIAERLHAIIKETAPGLEARTWYGMPAYAKDGKVLCHFKTRDKFKTRYATLGFSDEANLDKGAIWPTEFAVMELNDEVEAKIRTLVKKAVK